MNTFLSTSQVALFEDYKKFVHTTSVLYCGERYVLQQYEEHTSGTNSHTGHSGIGCISTNNAASLEKWG